MAKRKQKKPKVDPQLHPEPHPEPKPHKLLAKQPFTKKQALIAIGVVAIVGAIVLFKIFAATAQTLSFTSSGDATVSRANPNTNYGSAANLVAVAGTGRKDFLLKFPVSGISGKKIDSVKIRLYVTNGADSGGKIYGTTNTVTNSDNTTTTLSDWIDASVTWNNAYHIVSPPVIDSIGAVTAGHWYNFDVSSAVKADGVYTFRIHSGSTNNVVYGSRESAYPPQLVAIVEPPVDSAPPTAPTNLTAAVRSGSVADLMWGASSDNVGVVKYNIYNSAGTLLTSTANEPIGSTAIALFPLTPATQYSIYVKAVDAVGNLSPPSSITFTTNSVDTTDRNYTTPEGTKIEINTAGGFTYDSVYAMLKENAYPADFAKIAPTLSIVVEDTYPSQAATSTGNSGGNPTFNATIYLQGVNSTFAVGPDDVLAHEYGHAWTLYHEAINQGGSLTNYINTRWDTEDGSSTIGQDTRLNSTYGWTTREIIADDYRLLFASPLGILERDASLNADIPDPRLQPDLKGWLIHTWAKE